MQHADPPPASPAPLNRAAFLAALRARVTRLDAAGHARLDAPVPVCDGIPLPGGGLARAAVHEVASATPGSATAFCAVLLARSGGTVLWIAPEVEASQPRPPGLARLGLAPAHLVLVRAEDWQDALWAMEEALRCPAVTAALLVTQAPGRLDLTAMRRLQRAAQTGGALGLVLRPDLPDAEPSAAATQWRVGALHAGGGQGLEDPRWQLQCCAPVAASRVGRGPLPGAPPPALST